MLMLACKQCKPCLNEDSMAVAHRRALSWTVGRASTLFEQLYLSKAAEWGVRISTTM